MPKITLKGLSVALVALASVMSLSLTAVKPASASSTCTANIYSYGGYSTCIKYIQILANHKLSDINHTHLTVDGSFGPATRNGILAIQNKWHLTVDGIVGKNTWRALCSPGSISPLAGYDFSNTEKAAANSAGCSIFY